MFSSAYHKYLSADIILSLNTNTHRFIWFTSHNTYHPSKRHSLNSLIRDGIFDKTSSQPLIFTPHKYFITFEALIVIILSPHFLPNIFNPCIRRLCPIYSYPASFELIIGTYSDKLGFWSTTKRNSLSGEIMISRCLERIRRKVSSSSGFSIPTI